MNEIPKNNPNIPQQTQKIEQVKVDTVPEVVAPKNEETVQNTITNIPENPADRSSVKVDTLENDIKVFASNPELAAKALEVAELAEKRYAEAGVENAELKALAIGKAFVEEFQK